MQENIIAGLILLIIGGFYAIWPNLILSFQAWTQKKIMGAKYEPSNRTYKIVRAFGLAFAFFGIILISGIIK